MARIGMVFVACCAARTYGSKQCGIGKRRRAPANMAITTSLTDTANAFFTALALSRSTLRNANRRCCVIARLNGVAVS